eukprot:CAMPEP_0116552314 /NCGR_PEP_ID=MMETSP0397-20121206/6421_1 /TAXON_ID=216820 /ORGANISM="Cyclophora tenuis, Strain ECT3854" /LENGTH=71 /DNA_ID=CAMNT_0004077257 /DNA_START=219 /DNA_END=434 /DNA_ORIENTATION=-
MSLMPAPEQAILSFDEQKTRNALYGTEIEARTHTNQDADDKEEEEEDDDPDTEEEDYTDDDDDEVEDYEDE